jgi:hypothetical protein
MMGDPTRDDKRRAEFDRILDEFVKEKEKSNEPEDDETPGPEASL